MLLGVNPCFRRRREGRERKKRGRGRGRRGRERIVLFLKLAADKH